MHTDKPVVSVLMPAYNHQNYVQDSIKSIINQTYQDIELIVVDDGSKDDTFNKILELKDECEKRFKSCSFETQQNKGTCETLNKLISKANGDYIYIIASDDLVKPCAIECLVEFLNSNPKYGLVVGDNEIIDSNGKNCYWDENRDNVYSKNEAKFLTFVDYLKYYCNFFNDKKFGTYESLQIGNYIPNGYLIRKSILDIIEPLSEKTPLEDYYIMLQLSKHCKFKYIDEILFSYRWHGANSMNNCKTIEKYTQMVKENEERILSELDYEKQSPEIQEIIKYGLLYKRVGIPYLFELQTYLKCGKKIKFLKIFNIKIYKWHKNK